MNRCKKVEETSSPQSFENLQSCAVTSPSVTFTDISTGVTIDADVREPADTLPVELQNYTGEQEKDNDPHL